MIRPGDASLVSNVLLPCDVGMVVATGPVTEGGRTPLLLLTSRAELGWAGNSWFERAQDKIA